MIQLSVVTPTYLRPANIEPLLATIAAQTLQPCEIIVVDGAPPEDSRTEKEVARIQATDFNIPIRYIRSPLRGTSIQRNIGVEEAVGDFIALIDDDIRLESEFFAEIIKVFVSDSEGKVGGIVGHRQNLARPISEVRRWRWYKRLGLFTIYEPGRFDYQTGYPINQNFVAPFDGTREVDFMTTSCAVWRRAVFDSGLRFSSDLKGYAVIEDVHFSMRAGRTWQLLQCGSARCIELKSPEGRASSREIGYKKVYNYRYLFVEIVPRRSLQQEWRFWRYQGFQMLYSLIRGLTTANTNLLWEFIGQIEGTLACIRTRNSRYQD